MSDSPLIEPFAIPPKEAAVTERCGLTEIYARLRRGEYTSYLDGSKRMITLRSIRERRERLLAAASGTPGSNPSKRRGGPGRPKKRKRTITIDVA